jgi:hypothetical protein
MRTSRAYATELEDGFTHGGNVYIPEPFKIVLPNSSEDSPPIARLTLDNVTRTLVESIREIEGPIQLELVVVLAGSPDVVEIGPLDFEVRQVRWGATLECDLTYEPILARAVPAEVFRPGSFPGLFR